MKLADDVPFRLGMTIYTAEGATIKTCPETHEIESFPHEGQTVYTLGRKGSGVHHDLLKFYSSNDSVVKAQLSHAVSQLRYWTEEVVRSTKLLFPYNPR